MAGAGQNKPSPRVAKVNLINFTKNTGMLLLALYLILVGIIAITGVVIPSIVLGILALLAGIMILIGR